MEAISVRRIFTDAWGSYLLWEYPLRLASSKEDCRSLSVRLHM